MGSVEKANKQAMDEIHTAAVAVADATTRLNAAVRAGRKAGLSWADVGRQVGVSRQAARERWDRALVIDEHWGAHGDDEALRDAIR